MALLEAIRDYEANKWKFIGAKVGKPAKARFHPFCFVGPQEKVR